MDNVFSWLKVESWYHVFVLLGAAGIIASLTIELKGIGNIHALLLSLGVFFIGIGEWINHPLQTKLMPPNVFAPGGGVISGHPRNASLLGSLFDLLGIALVALGLYKIVMAP